MKAITLAPYSNQWPEQFQQIYRELRQVFLPSQFNIEHIGSTAVPGLAAKPVIDVLLGAPTLELITARIQALAPCGYAYVAKYEAEVPERRYFVRPQTHLPRVHLHGVVQGSRLWREHLGFRNMLRTDANLRAQYQSLKQQLANLFANDKAAYTEAKAPFIQKLLAQLSTRNFL
jgi:GrpB-like predicted nucleotidyltransferase (UPF0157 family)